jgi:hypothetical protein
MMSPMNGMGLSAVDARFRYFISHGQDPLFAQVAASQNPTPCLRRFAAKIFARVPFKLHLHIRQLRVRQPFSINTASIHMALVFGQRNAATAMA